MKFWLALLLVLVCSALTVTVSAETFEVPNSEISVLVDGSLDESEWADAGHVQFTAVNGEAIDVRVKYDVAVASLVFGVTVPDASFDVHDRFFIYVDNGDDIELSPQPDDFLIGLSRGTEYSGNYKRSFDFYRVVGTGSGWDINNLLFDSRFLTSPFGKLDWARTETGEGWGFEMRITLDRDPVHRVGLVFKQNDMNSGSSSMVYYPIDQPGATNYPINWAHTTIQSYTPRAPTETVEATQEPEPEESEITKGIPGFPFISVILGLFLITAINTKHVIKIIFN
jgi:hypothetical protein